MEDDNLIVQKENIKFIRSLTGKTSWEVKFFVDLIDDVKRTGVNAVIEEIQRVDNEFLKRFPSQ